MKLSRSLSSTVPAPEVRCSVSVESSEENYKFYRDMRVKMIISKYRSHCLQTNQAYTL